MSRQYLWTMCVLGWASVVLSGCMSESRVQENIGLGLDTIQQSTRAQYGVGRALGGDPDIIDMYEGDFEDRAEAVADEVQKLKTQIEKEAEQRKQALLSLVKIAALAAGVPIGGGQSFEAITSAVFGKVKTDVEKGAQDVTNLGERLDDFGDDLAGVTADVQALSEAAKTAVQVQKTVDEAEQEREVQLNKQLAKLDGFDQEKFKEDLRSVQELVAGKEGVSLREAILKEAKEAAIPKAMLAQLQGMTPTEIKTLMGTGGTAGLLGLLALARTFGRSRSQGQTDVLRQLFDSMKEEVDRMRCGHMASAPAPTQPSTTGGASKSTGGG